MTFMYIDGWWHCWAPDIRVYNQWLPLPEGVRPSAVVRGEYVREETLWLKLSRDEEDAVAAD